MDAFDNNERQLRIALYAIAVILPMGVIGYMLIEDLSLLDALWITVTTLTTIGYGDLVAKSEAGRVFTLFLIVTGLGSFALALNAGAQLIFSPMMRDARRRAKSERKIRALRDHYVICGEGELVDKTISFLLNAVELRRQYQRDALAEPINHRLMRILGKKHGGVRTRIREGIVNLIVNIQIWLHRGESILDTVVVVTQVPAYAEQLREQGLLVVEDDPTDDHALQSAGITHAKAAMALLESDTETLLNVLTMRSRNPHIYITATSHYDLAMKMTRVGANNVLAPYDIAGQFLNNATMRPAVNDFFNSILFDHKANSRIIHVYIAPKAKWCGKTIGELNLRERFQTGVIGLRLDDGRFIYVPEDDEVITEDCYVLTITPGPLISKLLDDCGITPTKPDTPNWQRLPIAHRDLTSPIIYSPENTLKAIKGMSRHYIICGEGPVLHSALAYLDPERPFVVVSHDMQLINEMRARGFRVVHGDLGKEETLQQAGIERALAMMVAIHDDATSVLNILNARTLNRGLLITASAITDNMIPKLRRAGADRVVSPFRIAAQFVLLATTRPIVADFLQYVLFNYQEGVETTELYMQDDSPWIDKSLKELHLRRLFAAGVIGIRHNHGRFMYVPSEDYVLRKDDVMIVITPMANADELRYAAHGEARQPRTLRTDELNRTVRGINRKQLLT